jgi:hypothetical protein
MGKHRTDLSEKLRRIVSQVHSCGGKIIIGGRYSAKLDVKDVSCDHMAYSIQDAVGYLRDAFDLKPGPKKKSVPKAKLRH